MKHRVYARLGVQHAAHACSQRYCRLLLQQQAKQQEQMLPMMMISWDYTALITNTIWCTPQPAAAALDDRNKTGPQTHWPI